MRAERGFGLLEVVIATGIIALVLGSVVGVLRVAARHSDVAARRVTAMYLAQESLEQARALRDSAAQDGRNARWTDSFGVAVESGRFVRQHDPATGYRWVFDATPFERIELDGVTYVRTTSVAPLAPEYAKRLGVADATTTQLGRRVEVEVRWGSARGESVRAATQLTDWRPGA